MLPLDPARNFQEKMAKAGGSTGFKNIEVLTSSLCKTDLPKEKKKKEKKEKKKKRKKKKCASLDLITCESISCYTHVFKVAIIIVLVESNKSSMSKRLTCIQLNTQTSLA